MPARRRKRPSVPRAFKDLAEILAAEISGVADFLAGAFAVQILAEIRTYPWALLIYPALLSGRGAVAGVLSGNLSTMLHLGSVKPGFRGNTDEYYTLVSAALMTSLLVAVYAFAVSLINSTAHGIESDASMMFFIIATTFLAASYVSVFISSGLAFLSFRRKLDPDVFTYPWASSINDAVISGFFCLILRVWRHEVGRAAVISFFLTSVLVVVYLAYQNYDRPFRKLVLEGLTATVIAVTISAFTGSALKQFEEELSGYPEILFVLPAILTCIGDLGSIYSSRMTTKLHLSEIRPELEAFLSPPSLRDLTLTMTASQIIAVAFGLFSSAWVAPERAASLLFTLITATMLGSLLIAYLGFLVAIGTFKNGWNPDNAVIPFVTSLADSILTWLILLASRAFY